MGTTSNTAKTKAALINAAGELFAAQGFHSVTARQITTKAGVALSAIPYHFGSMEALYREVLVAACEVSAEAQPLAEQALKAAPDDGLRLAIRWAIEDFAAQKVAWPVKLVEREALDPSLAFREVLQRKFMPEWDWLCLIVGRAADQPAASDAVRFGVITMYTLASTLMTRRRLLADFAPAILSSVDSGEPFVEMLAQVTLDAVKRYAAVLGAATSARSHQGAK
jgi:AcrR family transcriptional regulator